jgi:hypothetical protein
MGAETFNRQIALAIVEGLGDEEERHKWLVANIAAHLHNSVSRLLLAKGIDLQNPFKTAKDFVPDEADQRATEKQSDDEIAAALRMMVRY